MGSSIPPITPDPVITPLPVLEPAPFTVANLGAFVPAAPADPINPALPATTLQSLCNNYTQANAQLINQFPSLKALLWTIAYFVSQTAIEINNETYGPGSLFVSVSQNGLPNGYPAITPPAAVTIACWGMWRGLLKLLTIRYPLYTCASPSTLLPYQVVTVNEDGTATSNGQPVTVKVQPGNFPSNWVPTPGLWQCYPLYMAPTGGLVFLGANVPFVNPAAKTT